ncbi:hypothetical protein [Halopenitus persicus]|uniref:Uncharacterized protein n=1 Tax=Halopenitus persicus TaxID=1048396 RepID=A0A1H3KLW3_9EURY|nr:hypothetical protein [Halopenitus persicus]SDY52718.1 hypothetical protein SAMN05216564_10658 [Halopenitus persicus]
MGLSAFLKKVFDQFLSKNSSGSVQESSEYEQSGHHKDIRLVRVIDRTAHISPVDREREIDYVINNPTDKEFNFVFLPLREFKRNLQLFDEEGTKLNFYENRRVEGMIDQLKQKDPAGWGEFQEKFKEYDYKVLVQLPRERPLKPGDYRTIKTTFDQSETVSFHSISDPKWYLGWISRWEKKFFRIPTFRANVEQFPTNHHDEYIVIKGPPGYGTKGSTRREDGEPARDLYENGLDDDTRVISCRLPPAKNRRYEWDLDYDLIPNHSGLMSVLVIYLLLSIVAAVSSIILWGMFSISDPQGLIQATSGGFITATLGLIFALSAEWTNRYKILCVIPLLLHGGAWVLWQFT